VLLKVIVGWAATLKKSAERRCSSKSGWSVSMLAVSMVTSTDELARLARSSFSVPSYLVNSPKVCEKPRWSISKPM
jgi:hypothetical protein